MSYWALTGRERVTWKQSKPCSVPTVDGIHKRCIRVNRPEGGPVLVTGASGFIGSALMKSLRVRFSREVRGAVRTQTRHAGASSDLVVVGELGSHTDWRIALDGINAVVHTAARVHMMHDRASNPLEEFRRTNVVSTLNLAKQAVAAGVRRFIFLSSIKVNGTSTPIDRPFSATDRPMPEDAYGVSKYEAEVGLRALGRETGLEVVIIRPVLVYGPRVKANFRSMMSWIEKGLPLPLGSIENSRSLVALDNLIDLLHLCLHHPAAPDNVFLVSDGEDLSTPELLRRTAAALGRPHRLVQVPESVLRWSARLLGREELAERLLSSLRVDIEETRVLLGWNPPVTVDEALKDTARSFLDGDVAGRDNLETGMGGTV